MPESVAMYPNPLVETEGVRFGSPGLSPAVIGN
jgi:hypothetical protein